MLPFESDNFCKATCADQFYTEINLWKKVEGSVKTIDGLIQ